MRIQIIRMEAFTANHNQGVLQVKPQLAHSLISNHSRGVLQVKPQLVQGIFQNHNQGMLRVKPQIKAQATMTVTN